MEEIESLDVHEQIAHALKDFHHDANNLSSIIPPVQKCTPTTVRREVTQALKAFFVDTMSESSRGKLSKL